MKISKKRILSVLFSFLIIGIVLVSVFAGGASAQITHPGNTGLPEGDSFSFTLFIEDVMYWLLYIFLFIAIIGFVISGIMFITAGGSERAESARKWLTYSIIGVVVGLIGLVVINIVQGILEGETLDTI